MPGREVAGRESNGRARPAASNGTSANGRATTRTRRRASPPPDTLFTGPEGDGTIAGEAGETGSGNGIAGPGGAPPGPDGDGAAGVAAAGHEAGDGEVAASAGRPGDGTAAEGDGTAAEGDGTEGDGTGGDGTGGDGTGGDLEEEVAASAGRSGDLAHLRDLAARLRQLDRSLYAGKVAHDNEAVSTLRSQRRSLLASAVTFAERLARDGSIAAVPDTPAALALTPSVLASAAAAAERDVLALEADDDDDEDADAPATAGIPALQGSLQGDRLVLWAGAHGTPPAVGEELEELIREAGGDSLPLVEHPGVRIPGGAIATARSVDLASSLGWLVAVAAGHVGHDAGPSLGWLGRMAVFAVDLVARGQVVPTLEPVGPAEGPSALYTSRWQPVPGSEARRVGQLAARMPETVAATALSRDRTVVTNTVLATLVDAICRAGAARLSRQAPPVVARSLQTASEAFLSGLGNGPYRLEVPVARELGGRLNEWARPALEGRGATLMVRLSAPDELGAWRLRVFVIDGAGHRLPLATARARGNPRQQRAVRAELDRLTHLVPALGRGNAAEALLGNEEAWALMTETAPLLEGAGFVVQVPSIARSTPSARLRLESAPSEGPSVVGAAQLTAVKWSAVIDDVELNANDIRRLAAQAKPLIESRGKWVALDHATLRELADALAERDRQKQMTQADILRQALGLEGGLAVEVDGQGWASDVLAKAADARAEPLPAPIGFKGELRTYQSAARGWLHFLDTVGLGGCLALDMGLGKTPTVLAHLLEHRAEGPTLVIAPAAVVGNWAAEARKFAPSLKVLIHHGASRATGEDVAAEVKGRDIVITTYNTATRDADTLSTVPWARLVADEAQAIKNPVSEAARALMRIPATHKLALTGTPVENGLGDLWSILNFANPGLLGPKAAFEAQLARARKDQAAEEALRKMNGVLVFRRTKSEPEIAAELPDKIDQLDACALTPEQIGLYQAVVDSLLKDPLGQGGEANSRILAAITALKQICDHPEAYVDTGGELAGRSGKLQRLEELAESVFAAGERMLVFTHFATWGERLASYLTERFGMPIACYHGGLTRTRRDEIVRRFQSGSGAGALVVSLKAGGTGLNLTAANHVVLYDRWWNPAVEDQARDRAWRIGQTKTVVSHRLVCTGTVDEQIEEVVAGKRRVADLVLPKSSTVADLGADQLRRVLGLRAEAMVEATDAGEEEPAA